MQSKIEWWVWNTCRHLGIEQKQKLMEQAQLGNDASLRGIPPRMCVIHGAPETKDMDGQRLLGLLTYLAKEPLKTRESTV